MNMNTYPVPKITGSGDTRRLSVRHGRRRYTFDLLHRHEPEFITMTPGGQSWWVVSLPEEPRGAQVYADAVTPHTAYAETGHAPVPGYATAEDAAEAVVALVTSGVVPTRWSTWSR